MRERDELTITVEGKTYRGTWSTNADGLVFVSIVGGSTAVVSPRSGMTAEQLARVTFRELVDRRFERPRR